jgi:DNA invertase Pin-like site-specific DNA recombinase
MKNENNYPKANKRPFAYVRFSAEEQSQGDSERRQVAGARTYCQQHGLTLADTDIIVDRGVSSYHGRNHDKGELGKLLKRMQPGQMLLIEDPDRWSRESPLKALTRLVETVERGIEVVFWNTGTPPITSENVNELGVSCRPF